MPVRGANFHEDLRRSEPVRGSSDRNFGLVFAAFLIVYGLLPLRAGAPVRVPALCGAGLLLLASLLRPQLLHPFNSLWTRLGLLLGRIVNPVVTALLFFLVFVPAGLILRLLGKDPLHLKPAPEAATYWIVRDPPGPQPETMAKPF